MNVFYITLHDRDEKKVGLRNSFIHTVGVYEVYIFYNINICNESTDVLRIIIIIIIIRAPEVVHYSVVVIESPKHT